MTATSSEPQYKYVGDLNEPDQYSEHVKFTTLLSPSVVHYALLRCLVVKDRRKFYYVRRSSRERVCVCNTAGVVTAADLIVDIRNNR